MMGLFEKEVMTNPGTPFWVKAFLKDTGNRDPVDVLNWLTTITFVVERRADAAAAVREEYLRQRKS